MKSIVYMLWPGGPPPVPQLVRQTGSNEKHCIHVLPVGPPTGMTESRSSNDSMLWLICMLNNRVTTPVFCGVLPSIVLLSIPSPISWQCHLTPASLSCRQAKWFHNQIRNNQCNKNESGYRVIGRTSRLGLPVDHHDTLQTAKQTSFYFGHGEAGPFN